MTRPENIDPSICLSDEGYSMAVLPFAKPHKHNVSSTCNSEYTQ